MKLKFLMYELHKCAWVGVHVYLIKSHCEQVTIPRID